MKITGKEPINPVLENKLDERGNRIAIIQHQGLTIRQQFAAMAMQGIMASMATDEKMFKIQMEYFAERYPNDTMFVACAKEGVIAADALINELNK